MSVQRISLPGGRRQRKPVFPALLSILIALVLTGEPAARASSGYLLVSSFDTDSVIRYDATTGAYVDTIIPSKSGGLRESLAVIFGTDHNLYVCGGLEPDRGTGHQDVLRYNGATGAFIDDFADDNLALSPRSVLFGPDGDLYVANGSASVPSLGVLRFNGTTGAFMDSFVAPGSGGISDPNGMVFGPDGQNDGKLDLYVNDVFENAVFRYDGTTGAFKSIFVGSGSGGLANPFGMVFGSDGNLYVASGNYSNFTGAPYAPGAILRYEGPGGPNPGAFLGTFVPGGSGGLNTPNGLLFGPGGDLFVTSTVGFVKASAKSSTGKFYPEGTPGTNQVLRYDGKTGAFKGVFVMPDSGGLNFPCLMTFTETDPTTLNYKP
jgi:sugar lactone lactonase YvrE